MLAGARARDEDAERPRHEVKLAGCKIALKHAARGSVFRNVQARPARIGVCLILLRDPAGHLAPQRRDRRNRWRERVDGLIVLHPAREGLTDDLRPDRCAVQGADAAIRDGVPWPCEGIQKKRDPRVRLARRDALPIEGPRRQRGSFRFVCGADVLRLPDLLEQRASETHEILVGETLRRKLRDDDAPQCRQKVLQVGVLHRRLREGGQHQRQGQDFIGPLDQEVARRIEPGALPCGASGIAERRRGLQVGERGFAQKLVIDRVEGESREQADGVERGRLCGCAALK